MKSEFSIDYGRLDISYSRIFSSLSRLLLLSSSESKIETTTMNQFIDFQFSGLSFCLTQC